MSDGRLEQAKALIRQGEHNQARAIVARILREDSKNVEAWILMARHISDPEKQRQSWERVLSLEPSNLEAQNALARLTPNEIEPLAHSEGLPPNTRNTLIGCSVLALICVICGVAFALWSPSSTSISTNSSDVEQLKNDLQNAIGPSNRDVERIIRADYSVDEGRLTVQWSINDNLSEDFIRGGAKLDIVAMLEVLQVSGFEYSEVLFSGRFPLVDSFGNSEETQVVAARYARDDVNRINFEGFLFENAYDLTVDLYLHPTFRD